MMSGPSGQNRTNYCRFLTNQTSWFLFLTLEFVVNMVDSGKSKNLNQHFSDGETKSPVVAMETTALKSPEIQKKTGI